MTEEALAGRPVSEHPLRSMTLGPAGLGCRARSPRPARRRGGRRCVARRLLSPGATGFFVLTPDGTFLREMGLQRALDWSPDGRRVFGSDPWGTMVIVEERCGTALVAADGFRTGYIGWSPDGATVLVYSR